jgi:hypothetical protein
VPGRLNALIGKLAGEEKEGEKAGAAGSARLRRQAGEAGGRRKGRGKGEADRWGPGVSECKEKKTREGEAGRHGMASWAGRPGWAEGGAGHGFLSFFFNFFFSNHFSFEIQIKTPSNLFSKIYKLFGNHTSNQNPCKPTDDAQSLVVSKFIKLCLIF